MITCTPELYAKISIKSAFSYIQDVKTGNQPVNKWIRKAVERGERDRGSGKWDLDYDQVEEVFRFCSRLNIPDSRGKVSQFKLSPFQAWMILELFLYYEKDGSRRFTELVYFTGRKSGKTMIAAIISFFLSLECGYAAPEVYFAASGVKQAGILLKYCKDVQSYSRYLNARCEQKAHHIDTINRGLFQAVANKVGGELDGKKPLVTVLDECHALPNNQLRSAFSTGMGWSTDTLFVTISTAGNNTMNYFYDQIKTGKRILETDSDEDDKTLYILFTLDDGDLEREDLRTNKDIWLKSNPNLGITPPMSKFIADMNKAWLIDSDKQQFIIKNFNVFDDSVNMDRLFSMTDVNRNTENFDIKDFYGANIYMGLDLAPKVDISAIGVVLEKDGIFYSWADLFVAGTKEALLRPGTKVNFAEDKFKDDINIAWGHKAQDYDTIVDRFKFYEENFNIIACGYDPAYSGTLISRVTKLGIDCYPVKQYHISFNEVVMMLENHLAKDLFKIKENRILTYMFFNTLSDENKHGMRMPAKKESKIYGDAIDGVVSILSAGNMYIANNIIESAIYQFHNKE